MNMSVWEYNRAASETAATAVAVVTPAAGSYLVIDQINLAETAQNGGAVTIKRAGVPVFKEITLDADDNVDLIAGGKLRVNAGSALTMDVGAGIAVTMSGTMFSVTTEA